MTAMMMMMVLVVMKVTGLSDVIAGAHQYVLLMVMTQTMVTTVAMELMSVTIVTLMRMMR